MKISSIIVAGIAFAEAKKPKLSKSDFQDAKERGVSVEEEAMFEKCGGRPELPANAVGLKCKMWKGYTERAGKMEYSFIGCEPVCPAGWRPDQTRWTTCRLDHPKENRRNKWSKFLGPCIPLCPDMSEALKSLSSNVHVQHGVRDTWRAWTYEMPNIKFSCHDKRDQITIKGKFQTKNCTPSLIGSPNLRVSDCRSPTANRFSEISL